jgi:acylphosphatase
MSEPEVVRRYRVTGRVQGVGFRHFVWRSAQELGVDGWVRNRLDGSVECLVRATPNEHERLTLLLEQGPGWSRVDRVFSVDELESEVMTGGFEVRGTA